MWRVIHGPVAKQHKVSAALLSPSNNFSIGFFVKICNKDDVASVA